MAIRRITPPQDYLQSRLDYNPHSGLFIWRHKPELSAVQKRWNTRFAGKVAGVQRDDGYRTIRLCGSNHFAHRIAWTYMTGKTPDHIDHMNGVRSDNSFANLREATVEENNQNKSAHQGNRHGLTGVQLSDRCRSRPWKARIGMKYKEFHLGMFATKEEAHAAYVEAKAKFHPFQPKLRD